VLADVKAGIDANGNIVAYSSTAFGHPYVPYSGTGSNEMALELTGMLPNPSSIGLGSVDTSQARYTIPNFLVLAKSLPPLNSGWLMASYLRRPLGPQNNFIAEQMIDELAHAAGMDPVAFRLQNLNPNLTLATQTGLRTIAVLKKLAEIANWTPRLAASQLSSANVVTGRGVAITGNQGVIAEISVNKKTGKIVPVHMYAVQDPGLAINPASIANQMSGNQVMASSRALFEQVSFNRTRVTSLDWVTYPIMRFTDAPKVTTAIVDRPDMPSSGAGEATQEPVAGAIANAFFDATGVRIRQAPMTPARVRAVLRAAGAA
jgi:CO/xanthine dehydrogenase Mo-binding subunit